MKGRMLLLMAFVICLIGLSIIKNSHQKWDTTGWVRVPGNKMFGTGDFWIMKYFASCTQDGKPLGEPMKENVYDFGGNTTNANNCTPENGRRIASLPHAMPIGHISQKQASEACRSIDAHLLTNAEWQTVAWNVESVRTNWSTGQVGHGYLYSGHNDAEPMIPLPASDDDTDGYFGEKNKGGNQRRTLKLTNGEVIWDLSGNIWHWTADTLKGKDAPISPPTSKLHWQEFDQVTDWGKLTRELGGPIEPSWNSKQGMGQIFASGDPSDEKEYAILRGGTMDYFETSGIETLGIFNEPENTFDALGFRCAREI